MAGSDHQVEQAALASRKLRGIGVGVERDRLEARERGLHTRNLIEDALRRLWGNLEVFVRAHRQPRPIKGAAQAG